MGAVEAPQVQVKQTLGLRRAAAARDREEMEVFARAPFRVKVQLVRWRISCELRRLSRNAWRKCSACARRCAQRGQSPPAAVDGERVKPAGKRKVLGPPPMPKPAGHETLAAAETAAQWISAQLARAPVAS
jgi:hypothetical protein